MSVPGPSGSGRPVSRRRRPRRIAAVVVTACLISGLAASVDVDLPGASGRDTGPGGTGPALTMGHPLPIGLTVAGNAAMSRVPRSFLGLSTEYWSLPQWASQLGLLERVISVVHPGGTGPLVLRVGGDSADHSFWDPSAAALPRWAFPVRPQWAGRLRTLVQALNLRLILDLNLITDTPAQAAAWARAARAALPPRTITAFEIGNEPDIYSRAGWLSSIIGRTPLARPLPPALNAPDYVRDFLADARALAQAAPGIPLAGPALARPQLDAGWITLLEAAARRELSMITVHRYPYSACARPGSRAYPTLGRILSPTASDGLAAGLRRAVLAAHEADLPLRVTELNSVTCGGRPGVSNAFATALWAPSTLFALLRAGVDSVDIHVRANTINAPFALTRHGLTPRPLLYGMLLFSRSLGPRARLVSTGLAARSRLDVGAWAVRVGVRTLHVVVVDRGPRSVRVAMRLPAQGPAYVQRLSAPSAASIGGVTFAGQRLDATGRWSGHLTIGRVNARRGRYTVDVRRRSAVLVSVAVLPGALRSPPARARLTDDRRWRAGGRAPAAAPSPARSTSAPRQPRRQPGGRASWPR
jgi:hypothetical protein